MAKLYPNGHTIDLVQVPPRGLGLKFGLDWA